MEKGTKNSYMLMQCLQKEIENKLVNTWIMPKCDTTAKHITPLSPWRGAGGEALFQTHSTPEKR